MTIKKGSIVFLMILTASGILKSQPDTLRTMRDTIEYYKSTAKPIQELNSDAIDYAPSISADGRTMIFESNRDGKYELFESRLENGVWGDPVPLDDINNFGDSTDLIGGPSLSFDGNYLFFFASFREGFGREDIYYSIREGDGWSQPINIGEPINSVGYEGFPSISADGNTLYFVRQTYDELTDKDLAKLWENKACYSIFVSYRIIETGEWTTPVRLPYPINQDCEKAPRIMADNKTLIFASNRLGGYGEYDLYQTQLSEIGDWKYPQSLEFINSSETDQFASISAEGDKLYYVYDSRQINSVIIPPHLRQFKSNIIQGYITNGDTNEGIGAEIIVSDAFTSREIMRMTNNPNDGKYTVVLAVGNNYNIEIRKDGFTSKSFFYDLSKETEYKEIDQDITLFPSAKLNLNIYDIDIFEPISANIKVKAVGESSFMVDTENDPDGRITLDLPLGKKYEIIIDKENFESQLFTLDVSDLVVYRDFYEDIEMQPVKREIEINVADLTNNGKVRSRVRIRNRNRDEVIVVDGNETVALRVGDRYEIEATSDQGYAFNSTIIDVTPEGEEVISSESASASSASSMVSVSLKLQPLLIGANLTLKDILFETNSDQLNEISYTELARVVDLMNQNPSLNVEINAHTDDVGSERYNLALSERRAQSVVDYLIENKVSKERFIAKGLGESQPVVSNDTEENRAKNRRVVLKIVEI